VHPNRSIDPNDQQSSQYYLHNPYGNILQSTTQACASTKPTFEARSQFSEYDSNGRYLLKNRNALAHEEVKQYNT